MQRVIPTLLVVLATAGAARADEVLVDGIAAQVGTDIVLVSEVMQIVAPNERKMRAAGMPEQEIAKLRAEGLEMMIEARLIERVVRNAELYATDSDIDETIESIASANGLSLEQLKSSLATQNTDYDDYREEIKRLIERQKVLDAIVRPRVQVDEAEVERLYKERFASQPDGGTQVHLGQLLVPAAKEVNRTLQQSCDLVASLRRQIEKGASFEDLAREYSAAAPQQGGDIGWLHLDSLAGWMLKAIAPLQDGDVSEVVQLPFGCTLVQLVERKEYEPVSYEQAKAALQNEVFEMKASEEYRSWMEELRENTFIKRRGYFADAAQFGKSPFGSRGKAENTAKP